MVRQILAFGDSNTWGFIPGTFDPVKLVAKRYLRHQRWAGVMADNLGNGFHVIEEGLSGRTTVLSDPVLPFSVNGKEYLFPCLLSHAPLDLVILMLGTNDLKPRLGLNAYEIARGFRQLVILTKSLGIGPDSGKPEILIASPANVIEGIGDYAEEFINTRKKSQELTAKLRNVAKLEQCHFFDINSVAVSSDIDGIHFDADNQVKIGKALAKKVEDIFS